VEVLRYERGPTGDYHDDNWVTVNISLRVAGFNGAFDAAFLTEDFVAFKEQLSELHRTLLGEAKFVTLEDQLALTVRGNGRGGLTIEGEAWQEAGVGNHLHFAFQSDQTLLPESLAGLAEITTEFPIRAG
jgi:hypothetical protein